MNTHTKFSRQRILAIVVTTFLFNSTHAHAADNEQPSESLQNQQTKAFSNPTATNQVATINSHINSVIQASTLATSVQLGEISAQLETVVPGIEEALAELDTSLEELNTAVAALQTDIDALEVEINNLETVVADIPTLTEIQDALDAQTAVLQGEDLGEVDMTVINDAIADLPTNEEFAIALAEIEGIGFVSADNSLVAITAAIAAIPATDISTLATLANQQSQGTDALATLAGQALQATASGLTSAVAPLATSAGLTAATDSASYLGVAIDALPTNTELQDALDAQTLALQGATTSNTLTAVRGDGTGIIIAGGTTMTPDTNDLSSIARGIASIKGSGYSSSNSLAIIASQVGLLTNPTYGLSAIETAVTTLGTDALATLANQGLQATSAGLNSAVADIEGEGFVSADNSLVAISDAIAAIPATDISTLATLTNQTTQGLVPLATSAQAADILTAVQTDIPTDITNATNSTSYLGTAIDNLPTNAELATALSPLATASALTTVDGHVTTLGTAALATAAIQTTQGTTALATLAHQTTQGLVPLATASALTTVATSVTTLGTSALATAANLATTNTTVNNIDTAVSNLPTTFTVDAMIDAQTLALQGATTTNTLTALAGTGFVADTNSLVNICGTGFATGNDSLKVISDNVDTLSTAVGTTIPATLTAIQATLALLVAQFASPVTRATTAAASPALTTTLTSTSTATGAIAALAVYNASLVTALGLIPTATATSTQSIANTNAAITAVNTAITNFNALNAIWIGSGLSADRPSSTYSVADIIGALNQLHTALQFLLSDQTAAV
jgi:uncharacterized coiled-coil protein SlyX